jgi:hypothetical protein
MGRVFPPAIVSQYQKLSFKAVDDAPAFAYDSIDEWKRLMGGIQDRFHSAIRPLAITDPRLFLQEHEFEGKMGVCWRAKGMGSLYDPDPAHYSCRNSDQAAALRPELRREGARIISQLNRAGADTVRQWYDESILKLFKHKGAPYFLPGTDTDSMYAMHRICAGCTSVAQVERRMREVAGGRFGLVQLSFTRVQSSAKELDNVTITDGYLAYAGKRWGPKIRRVGAQPQMTNHFCAGVGNVLLSAMVTDPRTTGKHDLVNAAIGQYKYALAIDLSSFDTTVAGESIDAIDEEVIIPVIDWLYQHGIMPSWMRSLLIDIEHRVNHCPIIVPPWTPSEVARMVDAYGQNRSGIRYTSFIATTINKCQAEVKLRRCGGTEKDSLIVNYGDDTVLFTNKLSVIDNWVQRSTMNGFNSTIAPDTTFLMKRFPYGYSYFGRMVMGCINNESGKEPNNILAAAASFRTRYDLLTGHPLQDEFWRVLGDGNTGSERLDEAIRIAREPGMSAVDLAFIASSTMGVNPTTASRVEDTQEQLSKTKQTTAVLALRQFLAEKGLDSRVTARWGEFQRTAMEWDLKTSERYFKERAYH